MRMKNNILLVLCLGLSCSLGVYADNEHYIKRGAFPYMAFIYYSDPSVVDETGARFVRSAVLIRPDWLVTSALGSTFVGEPGGFPKKTLLARAGAVTVDANYTLNEDEDEQEREVIQIVRPYNQSSTQWWTTDISLMKTLLPFNITLAVGFKTLNKKRDFEKNCIILVYARRRTNKTEDKILMQLSVELLPPSIANCGSHFSGSTMTCAVDSDENEDASYGPDYCHGNNGGPLICENEVMGLQTYIGNNCKHPHLYQLLSAWDNFITCAIEDKCQEEQCGNICDVIYKDSPKIEALSADIFDLASVPSPTEVVTEVTITVFRPDTESTAYETPTESTTEAEMLTYPTPTAKTTTTTLTTSTTFDILAVTGMMKTGISETMTWPKEQQTPENKKFVENDSETGRKAGVEAQRQVKPNKLHSSDSNRNMCIVQTAVFGLIVLTCLI